MKAIQGKARVLRVLRAGVHTKACCEVSPLPGFRGKEAGERVAAGKLAVKTGRWNEGSVGYEGIGTAARSWSS